jgi:hypothetical protein
MEHVGVGVGAEAGAKTGIGTGAGARAKAGLKMRDFKEGKVVVNSVFLTDFGDFLELG